MEREQMCDLVTRVQQGDNDAASALYLQSRDDLYYYIFKTVNDPHLAEDLLQDSFMEILQTIDKLKEPAAFVTWSRQIAYHRCAGYFRKRHELLADENEEGQTVFDTVEEDRTEFIPDAALDQEDLKLTIAKMLDELPEEQKNALLLRYFDELSVGEIAKIQGVSEGTVKSRLNYGRKAVKSSVEDYEKKSGVKLHSVAILPLLLWFFREKTIAAGGSLTAKGAAAVATAAAGAKAAAGGEAARSIAAAGTKQTIKSTAKSAGRGVATRVIAGIAATAVVSGVGTALVMKQLNKDPDPTETTKATTAYLEREESPTTPATTVPEETQPVTDPLALPAAGTDWAGFGVCISAVRWYDMSLTEITETTISGELTVSLGAETQHQTDFTGTGTEKEGVITYQIRLETPHVFEDLWGTVLEETELVYDRQKKLFTMNGLYEVTMYSGEYWAQLEQELSGGTWTGMGNDDGYLARNNQHQFTLVVETLTTGEITGHLTVSYEGIVDHDTAFTGRARPRGDDGEIAYDIVFDTVRVSKNIWTIEVADATIVYNPGEDTFRFAQLQFYEANLEKN